MQSSRPHRQGGSSQRSALLDKLQAMRLGKGQCISLLSDSSDDEGSSPAAEQEQDTQRELPDRQPLHDLQFLSGQQQPQPRQQGKLRRLRKAEPESLLSGSAPASGADGPLLEDVVAEFGGLSVTAQPRAEAYSTGNQEAQGSGAALPEGGHTNRSVAGVMSAFAAAVATPLPPSADAASPVTSSHSQQVQHEGAPAQPDPLSGPAGAAPSNTQTVATERKDAGHSTSEAAELVLGARQEFRLAAEVAGMLYSHQRTGLEWLWSLFEGRKGGGILADDMGLGKVE